MFQRISYLYKCNPIGTIALRKSVVISHRLIQNANILLDYAKKTWAKIDFPNLVAPYLGGHAFL